MSDSRPNSEVGSLTATRTITGSGLFVGVYGRAPDDFVQYRPQHGE